MAPDDLIQWQRANQQYLIAALDHIRKLLQQFIDQNQIEVTPSPFLFSLSPALPALDRLCQIFRLSAFEQDILLLCAGAQIDSTIRLLCTQAQPELKHGAPSFDLANSIFEQCYWSAFAPDAPLRRSHLIEVGAGATLLTAPLRIDERILHHLMGLSYLDERLIGLINPVDESGFLVSSHQKLIDQVVALWQQNSNSKILPIIQLCGGELESKRVIASTVCRNLGFRLYTISSHAIPTNSADLQQVVWLWEREALLTPAALLLHWDESHDNDAARRTAIALLLESITSPLIVMSRDRHSIAHRSVINLDVTTPTSDEQLQIWHYSLGVQAQHLNGQVESLVSQFNLSANAIQTISQQALSVCQGEGGRAQEEGEKGCASGGSEIGIETVLWNACRVQSRPQLDDLAQRIESTEDWDDLVLPEQQKQILREIAVHVRQRSTVYDYWGMAGKGGRGLGISGLFSGVSGTGKTMAAGVLAGRLKLDLYRIDLSSMVSKYIGETEKNLRRVFDAAEAGGVVLLFDEADALFGKRSEVKDSHDRYANMEVSYLLQRMEAYRGLAILTTNLKEAIDPAFMRRIRFMVRFPFPEYGDRIKIWQTMFPESVPKEGLNFKKLAKLNIAGGNIRNIALNAAFLAAEKGKDNPITMAHLLKAAQSEYLKLERTLTDAEIQGWLEEGGKG
ncbi:MAG: ATP-binding protein [Leptolyngbyaceae cyanobacterium bins.302]|nr:ATP-binding protein [Leptolyngbyaceae cyanobacterium bins.302]